MKKRGRPRNLDDPNLAAKDEVIARTVAQLIMAGFSHDSVCETVGKVAAKAIGRTDHAGRFGLGDVRVKEIYEGWLKQNPSWPKRPHFSRQCLQTSYRWKTRSLEQAAAQLLANGGSWIDDPRARATDLWGETSVKITDYMLNGDPEYTPTGRAKNGMEK